MDLNRTHKIFFIGIGGIGMSALARYFNEQGKDISGYDLTPTPLTDKLISEGINIQFDEDISKIPADAELVIYTPAIPDTNRILNRYRNSDVPVMKRSEVLGLISENHFTIAIAGTHGKTSISAITAHLMNSSGLPVTALIGGVVKNFGSNVILSPNPEYVVLEADEYDRSFLTLQPDVAIISSIDEDHLDIYRNKESLLAGFNDFADRIHQDGLLITHTGLNRKINYHGQVVTYGAETKADLFADNIKISNGQFVFDFVSPSMTIKNISLRVPGVHYIENTLAAMAIGIHLGMNERQLKEGVESFKGVERRFDMRHKGQTAYIDDYAHHPEELKVTIAAARELYPERKIVGAFQPHLYSRTRDFANEFAVALSALDEVILLDIYPAREEPVPGVSSQMILDKIKGNKKQLMTREELVDFAGTLTNVVFLTLGAGDIGLLADKIKTRLEKA